MTAAEELRAAAAKLRETAAIPLEGIEPLAEGQPDQWAKYYGEECTDLPVGDGPWITLMTPKLAEPLAAWLEWAAWQADRNENRAPRHRYDLAEALAVARQINGTTS